MDLNVLYFAHVRERVGLASEAMTCPDGATVGDVVQELASRHPALSPLLASVRVAVNGAFASPEDVVPPDAEFVLIPPVSGGSGTPPVALVTTPLVSTLQALVDLVSDPSHGAIATFSGVVRNHARGQEVTGLEYEAYESMALATLEALRSEVEAAVPGVRVAVHHRIGRLEVGDVAVVVAAASAHRAEAFEACRMLMERLKQDVPIWKRETGPDGSEWVSDRP